MFEILSAQYYSNLIEKILHDIFLYFILVLFYYIFIKIKM